MFGIKALIRPGLFNLRRSVDLKLPARNQLADLTRQGLDYTRRLAEVARPATAPARAWLTARAGQTFQMVRDRLPGPVPALSAPGRFQPVAGSFRLTGLLRLAALTVVNRGTPDKATSTPAPARSKLASPWIISRKDDLIFLIGSSAVSYLFMALLFIFKVKPARVFWLYVLLFDGPHIFGTFSRTYADPEEWRKRWKLLTGSLGWFLPGPVMVALGLGNLFDLLAYLWAYFHLVKQHYGFSVLYKKKNNDLARLDNYLDKALIWSGFTLPYVQFMFGKNFPQGYLQISRYLPGWTSRLAQVTFAASLSAYCARQLYKKAKGLPLNAPKQMLLASSICMHMVTFRLPYARLGGGLNSLGAVVATLTVYHNTQYNRLIWFHNTNKYVKGAAQGQTFGLAGRLSKSLPRFALAGLLFGAAYRIPIGQLSQGRWGVSRRTGRYISAFGWGFAFVHYYLDSKIWRVRHDARLNKALQTGE